MTDDLDIDAIERRAEEASDRRNGGRLSDNETLLLLRRARVEIRCLYGQATRTSCPASHDDVPGPVGHVLRDLDDAIGQLEAPEKGKYVAVCEPPPKPPGSPGSAWEYMDGKWYLPTNWREIQKRRPSLEKPVGTPLRPPRDPDGGPSLWTRLKRWMAEPRTESTGMGSGPSGGYLGLRL